MDDPASPPLFLALRPYLAQLVTIALCLLLLTFCSLSEAALVRIEPARARQLAEAKRRGALRLERLVAIRQEVLNSLVLLINLCVIVASACATEITIRLAGERWVPLTSLAMILVLLALCEVTPKTYAVRRAEPVGLGIAAPLSALHAILRPLARGLHALAVWLLRRLVVPVIGGSAVAERPLYSDAEVMALVSAGEAGGEIEEGEKEMIHGVIEFADTVAREVMTPRTDMVCVPGEATLLEAARISHQTGYSRLPVFEGDVDHIIGVAFAKDMVAALESGEANQTARDIARKPAAIVPESKRIGELLQLMQRNRLHLAILIDEYGGTAGLVTIEDLLEEIFGEIRDEHDVEPDPIRELPDGALLADARVSADDIEDRLGVKLPEGEYDSLGGFLLDQLGRLPMAGEQVVWQDLEFTVEAMSGHRIERVRVTKRPGEADGSDQE